jgi:hypothetical protein
VIIWGIQVSFEPGSGELGDLLDFARLLEEVRGAFDD